jgi:polygalacturonase
VNIRELGAKGDGATDDTAVFRQAIAKNRAIYIPAGSYRITDTLTLGKDTVLIGLHPSQTRLTLANSTPGYTDPASPKPFILAPKGTQPVLSGIGIAVSNTNQGAVAAKWMAGAGSYIDDVTLPASRRQKGIEQMYGLWITDGGGGTFKNIWTPNESARNGFYVSDTSTEGRVYQMSVEHHLEAEVVLRNVENWTFYTLQTEENAGSEKAMAIDMEGCRNIKFVDLYMYHFSANPIPFPYGIRIGKSSGVLFRGIHNFSGGPFPFDDTLFDEDSGAYVGYPEIARLKVR